MTFHSGANQTSFITAAGSGDHTADLDVFAYEFLQRRHRGPAGIFGQCRRRHVKNS
jgi:hypothetical protein